MFLLKQLIFLSILIDFNWFKKKLISLNLPDWLETFIIYSIELIVLFVIARVIDWVLNKFILLIVKPLILKSKRKWVDCFYEENVIDKIAHLLVAFIAYYNIDKIFTDFPKTQLFLDKVLELLIVVFIAIIVDKSLKSLETFSANNEKYINTPIRSLSQAGRILIAFFTVIILVSVLFNLEIKTIAGTLAGTSAILILVFQDTINGMLSNTQITMNDLIRVGDWVTLNKYGADGTVMAIDLTTVKIKNFDKTISSVPAKAFVNDSFINWRSIKKINRRRIKRHIIIDISSIRFCEPKDIIEFSNIPLVKDYIKSKQDDIDTYNKNHHANDPKNLVWRCQSNIGIYRNYLLNFIKQHRDIDESLTIKVSQLQCNEYGVPLEIYCFTNTVDWIEFESIQDDIFDHLYVATEYFDLSLYQAPSREDFKTLKKLH